MTLYKVHIIYPNGEEEIIDQDFLSLNKAKEYAEHILGQVMYNAKFHKSSFDGSGNERVTDPYCMVLAFDGEESKVVFDSRDK